MKKSLIVVIFLLLPFVFAANIDYTIVGNNVLVEIEMRADEVNFFDFPENFEYSDNKIKYFDKNLIEKSGEEYFFIVKEELVAHSIVKVVLPEGAYVNNKYFIFPKNYSLLTDGQSIIIEWKKSGQKEILIPYRIDSSKDYWIYGLMIFVFGAIFFYFYRKKSSEKYTQNLFKEEKKIMNYLLKKKECWTKDIVKELGISKVRLSRKLRKLEENGLIEKIPYGNENKIKLK